VDADLRAFAQRLHWGIDRVDGDVAHANGAVVAIIDTLHADLSGNLGGGRAFVDSAATGTGTPAWQDDNGHGTHCAGIADAIDDSHGVIGVPTTATLHAMKVLSASGVGLTSDVAAGIEWTADQATTSARCVSAAGPTGCRPTMMTRAVTTTR
jgi:subtilisin